MKITLHLFFALIFFGSCASEPEKKETETMNMNDARFDAFKAHFIDELWKIYPGWASSVGYHAYDSILVIPNKAFHEKELAFGGRMIDSLNTYDIATLSANNKTDHAMMISFIQSSAWSVLKFRDFVWNPSAWNVGGGFAELLNGTYEPLENRLRSISLRMANVKDYYIEAKNNIVNPTLEHTALGIDQNSGSLGIFEKDIPDSVNACTHLSAAEKKKMLAQSKECALAISDYVAWLKALKNPTPWDFRLGRDLYAKKFELEIQSSFTSEEILQKALIHKDELHKKMFEITQQIWSKHMGNEQIPNDRLKAIRLLINKLSAIHVHRDSFQTAIEAQIPQLEKFVSDKKLIYLDPSKPLVVRKEPDYMAGVAGASISAPGPYDKDGNTYYNVGSLSGWPEERAESYLREYNHYILQILNIHEAVPGHYTQLVYSNNSPSLIKSILGNGAMVEGWAVYTERMMLEEGYGNNEPEMWLMYYKWNLRTTCNTILDFSVHNLNMKKEQAMGLLINEAFQQEAEANGKWKRATLTSVQLCSYFTGYTEIYELREEMKKKQGDKFDLKAFHEKFLSFGSAPVKEIKKLME